MSNVVTVKSDLGIPLCQQLEGSRVGHKQCSFRGYIELLVLKKLTEALLPFLKTGRRAKGLPEQNRGVLLFLAQSKNHCKQGLCAIKQISAFNAIKRCLILENSVIKGRKGKEKRPTPMARNSVVASTLSAR